jgi:glycosyltransferase involved in cell wall biosynthesis
MRALLLLYYFPPSGGPGVQRGVKLCRHLAELGLEIGVVTVRPETYGGREEYAQDPSLAAEVPDGLRVVRTDSGEPRRLKRLLQRTRTFRLAQHVRPRRFFERQAGWAGPALAACLREIETFRPDVLLTSSQPYVAHLVGLEARRRTGVPWAADFRDPWTLSWGRAWPSRAAFQWEDRAEAEVLDGADEVVMNTPGSARELLERRAWISPAKVSVVPNGYEPEDLRVEPAARPGGEKLLVHTGSFRAWPPGTDASGLRALVRRGAYRPLPYDLQTHSPEPLLRALQRTGPDGFRVRLVGDVDPGWLELAAEAGVDGIVEATGYLPHREAARHVLAADLLYLPTITRQDGAPVSNVPAKTYEYLGSGRPLAALAGPGDVRELVAGRERVTLLRPEDPEALAALLAAVRDGQGPEAAPVDPPDARPWRRGRVAERMRDVLVRAAAPRDKSHGALNRLP